MNSSRAKKRRHTLVEQECLLCDPMVDRSHERKRAGEVRRRRQQMRYKKTEEEKAEANSYAVGFAVRWKSIFQYVRMSFCPENVRNWSPSLQNKSEFSPRSISRAVSRFSRGPVEGNHRLHFSDPTGLQSPIGSKKTFFSIRSAIVIVFDPVGSQKCWRWFPATGPMEKRETAPDRPWRKLQVILRRVRPISNIFGAKAHANVRKGTFSTDCKSNCVRIGLTNK